MAIGVQLNQDPSILSASSTMFITAYPHEKSSFAAGIFRKYVLAGVDSRPGAADIETRMQPIMVRTPWGLVPSR
jgi:hypothetical protein